MAEGARLESVYTATYRGFESPPHRHILRRARTQVRAFFSHVAPTGGMRTPDRGSTTGAASWTDRERSEWAAPKGRAKRVNPPSPPYLRKSSYASTGFLFACCTPSHSISKEAFIYNYRFFGLIPHLPRNLLQNTRNDTFPGGMVHFLPVMPVTAPYH